MIWALSASVFTFVHFCFLIFFFLQEPCCCFMESESESHSVVSDSLRPHGLYSPWNSSGQNTGVGSRSVLQGIFLEKRILKDPVSYRSLCPSSREWSSRLVCGWRVRPHLKMVLTNTMLPAHRLEDFSLRTGPCLPHYT